MPTREQIHARSSKLLAARGRQGGRQGCQVAKAPLVSKPTEAGGRVAPGVQVGVGAGTHAARLTNSPYGKPLARLGSSRSMPSTLQKHLV